MSNVIRGGFKPWGSLSQGKGHFGNAFVSELANNYGTQISKYDIIIPVSDGTVAIGAAANNGLLMGVVIGCSYVLAAKRVLSDYVPASTVISPTTVGSAGASLVEWLPLTGDLVLEVQGDAAPPTPTLAGAIGLIGENCDLATATAGSTIGVSGMNLALSTHNTTAFNFRIVGIEGYTLESGVAANLLGNDPTATGFSFLVVCNEGFLPPYTTTGA